MRRLIVAVSATVLLAGGCGIPENSDVTVVKQGPSSGTSVGEDGSPPVQCTRESTTEPAQFVECYLEAAAGDPEGALARVKSFMSDETAKNFKAGPDPKVVRLLERPLYTPGDPEITLDVQQIGTLKSNGALEPTSDPAPASSEYKLQIAQVSGKGLYITGRPSPTMLLTDSALSDFYQRRTIYFWNTEQTGLVPDLRYMPRSVPTVQQPTKILNWLADGPSQWLSDSDQVLALQQGTAAPDNVPAISNDTLQVKLGEQAVQPPGDAKALDLLRRQLQWSLRPLLPRTLELRIGHQDPTKYSDMDFLTSNAAYRPEESPESFAIFNGVIRRLIDSPHGTDPVPVLKAADNKNLVAAAMSASATHTFAAVVAGSGKNQRLRVGAAPAGAQAGLKDVAGLPGTLGHPVWAMVGDGDASAAVGLIAADGRLYSFGADGSRARRVEWQGDPGDITAVSVAPDGHRVAVVAGGKLYRTVLGATGEAITMSAPEQLLAPTLTSVAAVAWSGEDWLTVAGVRSDRRVSIMDMSIDGALQFARLPDIGDKTVSYLTAYPANPVSGRDRSGSVSYTVAGSAWEALSVPDPIIVSELAGSTGNPPANMKPTAPFFLD